MTVTNYDKKQIGEMCKQFRQKKLQYTLNDMQNETGFNTKTISAFEHGKSSNMLLLLSYYKICSSESQKDYFIHRLFDCLNRGY